MEVSALGMDFGVARSALAINEGLSFFGGSSEASDDEAVAPLVRLSLEISLPDFLTFLAGVPSAFAVPWLTRDAMEESMTAMMWRNFRAFIGHFGLVRLPNSPCNCPHK